MQGMEYLIAAYAVAWIGLFIYLFVLALRIRAVQTELLAVRELVQEGREKGEESDG